MEYLPTVIFAVGSYVVGLLIGYYVLGAKNPKTIQTKEFYDATFYTPLKEIRTKENNTVSVSDFDSELFKNYPESIKSKFRDMVQKNTTLKFTGNDGKEYYNTIGNCVYISAVESLNSWLLENKCKIISVHYTTIGDMNDSTTRILVVYQNE